MKNLLLYYLLILAPFPFLIVIANRGSHGNSATLFVGLLAFYVVYRIFTDYYRLLQKGVVDKSEFKYFFIPFYRTKYFRELYFV